MNGQLERMFGYHREELLGQPIEVLVPERFRDAHVKHRDRYFEEIFDFFNRAAAQTPVVPA